MKLAFGSLISWKRLLCIKFHIHTQSPKLFWSFVKVKKLFAHTSLGWIWISAFAFTPESDNGIYIIHIPVQPWSKYNIIRLRIVNNNFFITTVWILCETLTYAILSELGRSLCICPASNTIPIFSMATRVTKTRCICIYVRFLHLA